MSKSAFGLKVKVPFYPHSTNINPTAPQEASNRFATVAISINFVAVEDAILKIYFYYSTAVAIYTFFGRELIFRPSYLITFFLIIIISIQWTIKSNFTSIK